jgi:hypothetical protein
MLGMSLSGCDLILAALLVILGLSCLAEAATGIVQLRVAKAAYTSASAGAEGTCTS